MLAVTAVVLVGCASASSGSSPPALSSGSPTPSTRPADSKAADLRTQLDLLLEEHVIVVAKQAIAASNNTDEYAGYATLLTTNANALVDVMRSVFGNTSAAEFERLWVVQNGYLVDYTIGLVTHNADKSNGAMSGLVNGFEPQFTQLMANITSLPKDSIAGLETAQVTGAKTVIDDEISQSYSAMYSDLRAAYGDGARTGDVLATQIAQQFPDKFPGDPTTSAVDARVSLNGLLQEISYLETMNSDAVIAGRAAEATAAFGALAAARGELVRVLGLLFGPEVQAKLAEAWASRDADLDLYAKSADAAAHQRLIESFVPHVAALTPAPAEAVRRQVVATLHVIDDQRSKSYEQLANDDRAAATAMQPMADRID
ncbi:MAG: hypothetical protein ABI334_09725 [Candidatus Dormiibacterota bacterium]